MIPEAVQAATVAAKLPLPVKMEGGSSTTGWITSGGILTILLMLFYALVKVAPKWRELGIGLRKDTLTQMNERLDKVERDNRELRDCLAKAERCTNDVRMHMVTLTTACHLLIGELHDLDPNNTVLKKARDLIGQAATDDLGWGDAAKKLAMLPGIRREQQGKSDGPPADAA